MLRGRQYTLKPPRAESHFFRGDAMPVPPHESLPFYREGSSGEDFPAVRTGTISRFQVEDAERRGERYSLDAGGRLSTLPSDGTYLFVVLENDGVEIELDGAEVGTAPRPFAQVCGLAGNAAQAITLPAALC